MGTLQEREVFLTNYMLKFCTDLGFLQGTLLNSSDIDGKWQEIAPDFCAEAARELRVFLEWR